MTHTTPAAPALTTVEGARLPSELRSGLPPARSALWETERELWTPRTTVARDASGRPLGAALTAGRPLTAARKIVDAVADSDEVWAELVAAARDDLPPENAEHPAPIVVHFEEYLASAPLSAERRARLTTLGFTAHGRPVPSVPSTRPGDPSETAAWSWWRDGAPARIAPYYGQTTEVTCGAVSSLMAQSALGAAPFSPDDLAENRAAEIAFWRRATNLPACEPIGLAVETAKALAEHRLAGGPPHVLLSTDGPVLVDEFSSDPAERALRVDLQRESLRQAEQLGLPIERRWIEVDEIAERIRAGAWALLLIDLTELIADPTPHWVLATEVIGGSLLVSDPWVQYPNGETWVDAFALPIPLAGVDRVTRWGDPAYRGVILLPGAAA